MSTIVGLLASNAKTKWIIEQAGLYDCFRSDHLVIADGVPESRRRDPAPGLRRYTTVRYIEFLQTNVCQCGFSISVENGRDLFLSYDSFFFSSFSLSLSLSLFLSQSCVLNMCKWKFDRKISFGTKKLNFGWKMNTRKSVRISFVPKKIFSRCDFIWDFMNIYISLLVDSNRFSFFFIVVSPFYPLNRLLYIILVLDKILFWLKDVFSLFFRYIIWFICFEKVFEAVSWY